MINLSLIVALSKNNVIGNKNELLWHIPKDLEHFKRTTMQHAVIMGRKTFDSIKKPLPGRRNIILSKNKHLRLKGCFVVSTLNEAFNLAKNDNEPFIIGGSQIYKLALPFVKKMYITHIEKEFTGDANFPEINYKEWRVITKKTYMIDKQNPLKFKIKTYLRS